jgi:hypothetical protein
MSLDPIGELLTPFLEKLGVAKPDTAARLNADWETIAGEPWARQTRPAGLRSGELLVEVVDAATVSLLRYRTGELLERLDEALGQGAVEVVRMRVARQPF